MKKYLLLIIMAGMLNRANGQITTPIVKANFGIESDLSSNFYNNAAQPAVDDWYSNGLPGTGVAVIDTSGAASIVAGYTSNPASRSFSFSRLMKQPPFSTINNRLLIDAVFHRDYHGSDSTVFAAGSNKNGMSPFLWSCPAAQSIPDKNDILDAFTHVRRAGPNVTDSLWMFGAISIENTTGSRYFDFELYQTDLVYNRSTRTFTGYGPDAGHTSWTFDGAGNILLPGDIIFTAEFSSSALTQVQARIWVHKSALSITPSTFNWGGAFDGDGSGAVYGYANILPKTSGAFYTGIQSIAAATWAGPFALVRDDNSVVANYTARQFMEFAVNLTKLGIEPASFSSNACGSPFRRVLIKTRASTSFTAELKDFIAPFRMFEYPLLEANTFIKYFCEVMPPTTISVYNPIPTSTYIWSTNNGNIFGPTTGPTIIVNAPGTYYVTQQLHVQCPVLAMDSVTIFFDSVCTVLNLGVVDLTVNHSGKKVSLNWKVSNNEYADNMEVEYSYDNFSFHPLANIPAKKHGGYTLYTYNYTMNNLNPVIYYRIKLTGINDIIKFSSIVSLNFLKENNMDILIYPNPSNGELWMSMYSKEKKLVSVSITDMTGRLVKKTEIRVMEGNNQLDLHSMTENLQGMYIIKIKHRDGNFMQKLLIKNYAP